MKGFLLSGLIILSIACKAADTTFVYYSPVSFRADFYLEFARLQDPRLLAEDAAIHFQKATGKPFSTKLFTGQTGRGIYLLLDSTLKYKKSESSFTTCDGINKLIIKGRYIGGISYGLYTYLDKLGFRFYLPGENWTQIPTLKSVFIKHTGSVETVPAFAHRYVGVSGELQRVPGLDETRKNMTTYFIWMRRNRMGSEYQGFGGHIGELFNIVHKKEIEKDPQILAPVEGKRVYREEGKIDPTYKKGVDMFTDWLVNQYRILNDPIPSFVHPFKLQSADMGDGLNYCHTPACKTEFGTVSNQATHLANMAARKIRKKYPGAGINIFAYTERTDTPSYALDPNVHVGIVATAFHNVATPAGLIRRWGQKRAAISAYDYVNIPIWSIDAPHFNLESYFKYLRFLRKNNVEGLQLESGVSQFASSVPQYFILRFLNNPQMDLDKEFDALTRNLFGVAADPVKKVFQEWYFNSTHLGNLYDRYTFRMDDLSRFATLINKAQNNPSLNKQNRERIEDLKYYLVFLHKSYNLWNNLELSETFQKDPAIRDRAADELIRYTWPVYDKLTFHNTQTTLVIRDVIQNADLKKKWDIYAGCTACADAAKYDTKAEVQRDFARLLAYPEAQDERFEPDTGFFEKALALTADSILLRTIDPEAFGSFRYPVQVYCSKPGILDIRYEVKQTQYKNGADLNIGFTSLQDENYEYLEENFIRADKRTGSIRYKLPKKGFYTFSFAQQQNSLIWFIVKPNRTNLLFLNKKLIPMNAVGLQDDEKSTRYDNQYLAFYMPNRKELNFNMLCAACGNYTRLYNYRGDRIDVIPGKQQFEHTAKLKDPERNNFLYYENEIYRWPPVYHNIPPYFFYLRRPEKLKN